MYSLLGLWSRWVISIPNLKGDAPCLLDKFVPKIVEGFIASRIDSAELMFLADLSDNPLDNVDLLHDQLDCFPFLCKFQYDRSGSYTINIMDPILQFYKDAAHMQIVDNSELVIAEAKLAWIVHIIASVLKTRQCSGCSVESLEMLDAELSARVLQLASVTDSGLHSQRYGEFGKQRLDRAILSFFQNFRKSYIGDQAAHASKLYARLSELLGLHDHLQLLNVIVGKIISNLKYYTMCEEMIHHTLSVFLDLTSGFMIGKLLLKLDTVKFVIANHARENFPFMGEQKCSRSRTTFYYIIGSLIFMEDAPLKFKCSMEPFNQVLITLESAPDAAFRTDSLKFAMIGLMRDLRGIAMATNSHKTYGLLFDWLYPAHMPLLLKGISLWADTPEVTTPLLKFMAEFVQNKSQRLNFDSSSPNGILLFREASKLIVSYGTCIVTLPDAPDLYAYKYKGIWICLTILSRAISGKYVNFGVFELYGDRALSDALDIALRMVISVPLADIMAYQKLMRAYFAFLEILFSLQLTFILNLDTSTFLHLVASLESGLKGLDLKISSQSAAAIDNLATFYFNNIILGQAPSLPAAASFIRHVTECLSLFPEMLKNLFEIVLFEDCSIFWSLSRPILALILIDQQMLSLVKTQILSSQPVDRQQRLSLYFDKLLENVTRSLEPRNRDRFTQNLTLFCHEFRAK